MPYAPINISTAVARAIYFYSLYNKLKMMVCIPQFNISV